MCLVERRFLRSDKHTLACKFHEGSRMHSRTRERGLCFGLRSLISDFKTTKIFDMCGVCPIERKRQGKKRCFSVEQQHQYSLGKDIYSGWFQRSLVGGRTFGVPLVGLKSVQ